MEFDIRLVGDRFQNGIPQDYYRNLLSSVSSHNNEDNIPGRELRLMVYEKNTNKIVGFIRLQSPLINSKPRNEWLGKAPDLKIFNRHAVMGFAIVPSVTAFFTIFSDLIKFKNGIENKVITHKIIIIFLK